MTKSARSIYVWSAYLALSGVALMSMPNTLTATVGIAPASEVWIRVVGMLVFLLAYYYFEAARSNMTPFFRWSVTARCAVILFFIAFVALGWVEPGLILFGVVDLAGALWTALALRAEKAHLASTG